MIKLKALIYRYTGVYLAHKEENEYLTSKEYWKSLIKLLKSKDKDLRKPMNAQDLLIGIWQSDHGFHRPMSFISFKEPQWLFRPIAWFVDFYTVLKWDIMSFFRRS